MNMNRKRSGKMMRGFMCHSPAATAVCMTGDGRSVIVPRRPDHHAAKSSLINNGKYYSRLQVDHHHHHSRRFGSAPNKLMKSTTLPPISQSDTDQDTHPTRQKPIQKPSSVTAATDDQVFQVVVMRVSLHCQGCAGKVKKHLSKMEGVTSFSIDLESKRVTVMGHVSPDGVLESVSKVKRAEFWSC